MMAETGQLNTVPLQTLINQVPELTADAKAELAGHAMKRKRYLNVAFGGEGVTEASRPSRLWPRRNSGSRPMQSRFASATRRSRHRHVMAGASGAVTSLPPVRLAVRDLRTQIDRLAKMHGNSRVEPSGYAGLMQRAGLKIGWARPGAWSSARARRLAANPTRLDRVHRTGVPRVCRILISYIAHFAEV